MLLVKEETQTKKIHKNSFLPSRGRQLNCGGLSLFSNIAVIAERTDGRNHQFRRHRPLDPRRTGRQIDADGDGTGEGFQMGLHARDTMIAGHPSD